MFYRVRLIARNSLHINIEYQFRIGRYTLNENFLIKEHIIWSTRGVMGRRKSKRKPPSKKKAIQPLDTQFNCPFCNHEKSCEVKMHKSRNTAKITCRVCLEDFQTTINLLSEPLDVYNDWIDACENANWRFITAVCNNYRGSRFLSSLSLGSQHFLRWIDVELCAMREWQFWVAYFIYIDREILYIHIHPYFT